MDILKFWQRLEGLRIFHSKNVGEPIEYSTHLLSNQAVMNFRDLRNIEAAFFVPVWIVLP